MKVEVVSIGDELLRAEILDTNASYLARCLRQMGLALTARVIVGDRQGLIAGALGAGLKRADVVISSGGLGTKNDDFTRQAVADLVGNDVTHSGPGIGGSTPLGAFGGAQGILLETETGTLICLPGNQRDVSFLVQTEVLPYLERRMPGDEASGWLLLRTAGVMESNVRELLADLHLRPGERMIFASYAGQTDIRVTVKAGTEEAVRAGLERLAAETEARLGNHVYGRNRARLGEVTVHKLQKHDLLVGVAEHDTGEATAQMVHPIRQVATTFTFLPLNTHPGISRYLGIAPLADDGDLPRWCRMAAERLREQLDVDLGLVVFKNVTPGGVQLLVTLAGPDGVSVSQRSFGGHPENINHWAGTMGLVHLRRWLLTKYPE